MMNERVRRIVYLGLLFLFLIHPLAAQTVLEGTIRDENSNKLLCDVICTATDFNGKRLLGYAITDTLGAYRLDFQESLDSVCLRVSLLGYKPKLLRLVNHSRRVDIELEVDVIELKEVSVKSQPIWSMGDTLNYNVGALKSGQDEVIGDVLKKLPGIEVNKQGGISYQGRPINRFYIEGLDLLGNKYSIATNNVPVGAVERVQVFENHQPIRALNETEVSDQAAINLKLKDEKMLRPIINAEIGAGGESETVLVTAKLFGMQAGRNQQSLATFKMNNTGQELWSELADHSLVTWDDIYFGIPSAPSDLVRPVSLAKPATEEQRYLDNKSYIGTFNQLWRVGEDAQIRITGTYLNDRTTEMFAERNEYYLGAADSSLVLDVLSRQRSWSNQGEAVVSFTSNASTWYVDNKLKLFGRWQHTEADVNGTMPMSQYFSMPLFVVENKLDLVKKKGKKSYKFSSFMRYSSQPQKVRSRSDSLLSENLGLLQQSSERSVFCTYNHTSLVHTRNSSLFKLEFRFNVNLEYLNSNLNRSPWGEVLPIGNRLRWNQYEYAVVPGYSYRRKNHNLEINVPLHLVDLYANDRGGGGERNHVFRLLANPSVSYRYAFNLFWNLHLSYRFNQQVGDMLDYANGLRMTDFRTFTVGSGILEDRTSQSYALRLTYRNQASGLFYYLSAVRRSQYSNLINQVRFVDNYMVSSREKRDDERIYTMLNVYLGKYFYALKTNIGLNIGYTNMQSEQFQQRDVYSLSAHLLNFSCKVDVTPTLWTSLALHTELLSNKILSKTTTMDWLTQFRSQLGWYLFPLENWNFSVKGEYVCNENGASRNLNLFFLDGGVKYTSKYWDISIDGMNLLNKRSYTSSSYDGVNNYSSYYQLRGATCLVTLGFKI